MRTFRTSERSAEECLRLWPTVMVRAPIHSQDWQFADRIEQQAMRPGWVPSPSQLAYMRKLVATYALDGIRLDPDLDFSGDGL